MFKPLIAIVGFLAMALPVNGQTAAEERTYNDQVRNALLKEGDNGLVPREVQHWAYPAQNGSIAPSSIKAIIADLQSYGFAAERAKNSGVSLRHVTAVKGKKFDEMTMSLRAYFASKGWRYDGWETFVIRKGN